jgi:hypothetical protein
MIRPAAGLLRISLKAHHALLIPYGSAAHPHCRKFVAAHATHCTHQREIRAASCQSLGDDALQRSRPLHRVRLGTPRPLA